MHHSVSVRIFNTDDPDALGFGRGIVTMLERVEEFGSINKATGSMGMAYSKAWKILKRTEAEFGIPLVHRDGAHGSTLTEEARTLMKRYYALLEAAEKAADAVQTDNGESE